MLPPKRSTRSTSTTSQSGEVVPREEQTLVQTVPHIRLLQATEPCSTQAHFVISTPQSGKTETTQTSSSEKKTRRKLTADQRLALEEMASREANPSLEARRALAEDLGLELKVVSVWFQNKRRPSNRLQEGGQVTPLKIWGVGRADQSNRRILGDVIANVASNESPLRVFLDHDTEGPPTSSSMESVGQQTLPGIWDFLPSSPPGPTADVSPSEATLPDAATESPNRQSKRRSLEWACLNDQRTTKRARTHDTVQESMSPEPLPAKSTPRIRRQRTDKKPQKPSPRILDRQASGSQCGSKSRNALFRSISFDNSSLIEKEVLDAALALIQLKGSRSPRKSI